METELERHHSTVSDHELKVDIDGDIVVFRERKEFCNVVKNSNEIKSISIHTRFIGGDYVTVAQTMKDGKSYETTNYNFSTFHLKKLLTISKTDGNITGIRLLPNLTIRMDSPIFSTILNKLKTIFSIEPIMNE